MNDKEKYPKLLVRPIERFDQMKDMFRRARYDLPGEKWSLLTIP